MSRRFPIFIRPCFGLCVLLGMLMTGLAHAAFYEATRLNGSLPIIDRSMFEGAGVASEGDNINGPSVIRIPDWIAAEDRADPTAAYYLYFGDHDGRYIRMAWAAEITGPYHLYQTGNTVTQKGVLDLGSDGEILLNPTPEDTLRIFDHISSPDVHVDDVNERIVLYFHGPAQHNGVGGGGLDQKTFVAYSPDGLDFNTGIEPVYLGLAYLRVFDYGGTKYGIASRGNLYTAPVDYDSPPAGFDYGSDLWTLEGSSYTDTPFQHDIDADGDGPERLRHVSLRVNGDTLEVFHSRVGDRPERILYTTIDLTGGAPSTWDPVYPPLEIGLFPEEVWEGAELSLGTSGGGASTNVRELRDPCVFEDYDGTLYLFYSGRGEEAIGIARLDIVPTEPDGPGEETNMDETGSGLVVSALMGDPALVSPSAQVDAETKLTEVNVGSATTARLVGATSVLSSSGSDYFYQDVDPGTAAAALAGLSLTQSAPNADAKFFYDASTGVSVTNAFLFIEIGGNDAVTFYPIDSLGNDIGTYALTLSNYSGLLMTTAAPQKGSGGSASNPSPLHGVLFNLSDFSGSGDLSDFSGFRLSSGGADPVLLAAILTDPLVDGIGIDDGSFRLSFLSYPGNRYDILRSVSSLNYEDFESVDVVAAVDGLSEYSETISPASVFYIVSDLGASVN